MADDTGKQQTALESYNTPETKHNDVNFERFSINEGQFSF